MSERPENPANGRATEPGDMETPGETGERKPSVKSPPSYPDAPPHHAKTRRAPRTPDVRMQRRAAARGALKKLGRKIRRLREDRGLSVAQFAKQCRMKVPQLEHIETGDINLQVSRIVRIARQLNVTVADLFDGVA